MVALHPGIIEGHAVGIGRDTDETDIRGVLRLHINQGRSIGPGAVRFRERVHGAEIRPAQDVGLENIGSNRRCGEVRIAAFQVVQPAPENQPRRKGIVVKPFLQRSGQAFKIPARTVDHDVVGVGRGEVYGHVDLGERHLVTIQRPDDPGGVLGDIAAVEGHLRGAVVEDDLGRGETHHCRQTLIRRVLRLVLTAEIGQRFAALQHGISRPPIGAVAHLHRVRPALGFGIFPIGRQPGQRGTGIQIADSIRSRVEPEIGAHGIPVLVEEAAIARDHPGIQIAVLPDRALEHAVDLDISALMLRKDHVPDHQVERIGRNQDVARKTRVIEIVHRVSRLGDGLGELIQRLVRDRIERGKQPRAGPGRVHPVGRHLRLAGLQVVELRQGPRIRRINPIRPIRPVNPVLQRERHILAQVELVVPGELILDGWRHQAVFLVRVEARDGWIRLVVDFQIRK